jgi:uncharacterized repeat protein (TIGR01451 family)
MKKLVVILLPLMLIAFVTGGTPWAQEKGNIELKAVAEVEVEEFNEEGMKVIKRVPAGKVLPGTEVIYTVFYTNVGKAPAEKVIITNPIPEHMVYKEGSGFGEGTVITFSVDKGKTYDVPENLKVVGDDGKGHPAKASDYTHVRWSFPGPLPAHAEGHVSFRAILE